MSVTDRPQRSSRHTSTRSTSRRRAASSSFSRLLRWEAPEPISLTCKAIVQPRRMAYSRRARVCNGLEGPLQEIIKWHIALRFFGCDLIFHRDGKPVGEFRKLWKSACKLPGVSGRIPYDLRRTSVRNMVRAGVPERVAMMISGHRTRQVFDRYNIVSEKDLREAVSKRVTYVESLPINQNGVPIQNASGMVQ